LIRVLFVCLGNICRSPSAEGVFRALVNEHGLSDRIGTDSCGTSTWHIGSPPDNRARGEAKRRGISIDDLRARALKPDDFEIFDYILAMDGSNLFNLEAACPDVHRAKVHLLLEFAPDHPEREVPDPYYGGAEGFAQAFDMIDNAAAGLLADIQRRHLGN